MIDASRLVRRLRSHPMVWLGEKDPALGSPLGARFPAYPAKEKDLVFTPPRREL